MRSPLTALTALAAILTLTPALAPAAETTPTARRKAPGRNTKPNPIPKNIEGVTVKENITYLTPDRDEKLDLYLPAHRPAGVRSPAIVMIHGGGWVGGDKAARREVQAGALFAQAGYVTVSAEYEKTEGQRWPTNVHDCKNAVRWLRKNADELKIDPDRIGVIGGSAGGHLALMVAVTSGIQELEPDQPYPGISSAVSACVNLYGITNPATRQGTDKQGNPDGKRRTKTALFSETIAEAPEKYKLAAPVTHLTSTTPPILTLHGTADATVDRDQATELDKKAKAAGARHELVMIEGAPHSFILKDDRLKEDLTPKVLSFFDKHLKK